MILLGAAPPLPAPTTTPDAELRAALARFVPLSGCPAYLRTAATTWLAVQPATGR